MRPLGAAEAALMPIQMRSDYGAAPQRARMIAGRARDLAKAYPFEPFVQATLAEAEYDADNYAEAEAAADRAIATDPNNVHALIYKARVRMQRAKTNSTPLDGKEVRSWLSKANRLDTENAEPLMLYYQSFAAAGERPTDTATKGLLYAMVLAPQDSRLRWMVVRQLLLDRKVEEARRALTPIAFDPHAGSARDRANLILTAIESGDFAQGVSVIETFQRDWKRY